MAKSSRSSSVKSNNQRLKSKVFGPVEAARAERLSARLRELAAQPKPQRDVEMEVVKEDDAAAETKEETAALKADTAMEVDAGAKPTTKTPVRRTKIQKRRTKRSLIVFPKYGDRSIIKKKK